MAGIFGVFLKKDISTDTFLNYLTPNKTSNEFRFEKGLVGRSVIDKLSNDRFFETRGPITICFEGVNLSDKIKDKQSFFEAYREQGTKCIESLKGSFSGFILDKNKGKVCIFNDHLASKSIFYFYDPKIGFIFSSELKSITRFFNEIKIPFSLNRDAVYMMALYGFTLEDNTYVNEMKRLPYSSSITYNFNKNDFKIRQTQVYNSSKIDVTQDEAVKNINTLFESSVKSLWNKNLEYGDEHLSLLSGGMDAKTNVLVAKNLGFKNLTTITFGQSNSTDVRYANNIAKNENFNHFQRFLDFPSYLIDDIMKNYIEPLDGLMMFHSSAHASSTIKSFNLDNYALIQTGQLGDPILGSATIPNFNFSQNRGELGYTGSISNENLLDKIEMLPDFLEKYQNLNYNIFNIEQRQINATLNGDRALNSFIDNVSPFSDLELIKYCLSLPDHLKKNQLIYFNWLSKYHENILNYPWEKIQMKPNTNLKINYGRLFKKYYNGAKKYFNLNYDSMNPYSQWIKKYPFILDTLDHILKEELENLRLDNDLKEDLRDIYNNDVFEYRNKFAVITALLGIKLHFTS